MPATRTLLTHPSGRIGGAIILLYGLASLAGAVTLVPFDPLAQVPIERLQGPNGTHIMGTDLFGRDVFSRLVVAVRTSLVIAVASVAISSIAGTIIGLFAAWWGGWRDMAVMRVMDVFLAFPAILLALLIVTVAGPGTTTTILAIGVVYTPIFARVARGPALSIKTRDFVDAARTFSSAQRYILTRHLLLNLAAPLTVQVTLALSWALLTEAGLSFLGLGTQPPSPSLGLMLAESRKLMEFAPWLMAFPGAAILLGVLGFNLLGDALRDVIDPRTLTAPA